MSLKLWWLLRKISWKWDYAVEIKWYKKKTLNFVSSNNLKLENTINYVQIMMVSTDKLFFIYNLFRCQDLQRISDVVQSVIVHLLCICTLMLELMKYV